MKLELLNELIDELISGKDIASIIKEHETLKTVKNLLHIVALYGKLDDIDYLISLGTDINCTDKEGYTALNRASENKHLEKIEKLLSIPGIDVNIPDKDGETPLFKVCWKDSDIAQLFLTIPNINVNFPNKYGRTPLSRACRRGFQDLAIALLNHPKIDIKKSNQALIDAVKGDLFEIVEILLKYPDINVNIRGDHGYTPLICACDSASIRMIRLLLSHKDLDVNLKTNYGFSALWNASFKNRPDVVKLLLNVPGINVNDGSLDTAISKHLPNIVQILVADPRVDVNLKTYKNPPIFEATIENNIDAIMILLQRTDIDINATNGYGDTALHACFYKLDIMKILLADPRIDISILDKNGKTFFDGIYHSDRKYVQQLLDDMKK